VSGLLTGRTMQPYCNPPSRRYILTLGSLVSIANEARSCRARCLLNASTAVPVSLMVRRFEFLVGEKTRPPPPRTSECPLGERDNPFPDNCVMHAKRFDYCLLKTSQIFQALSSHQRLLA
jgi:hypothetical protein